MDYEHIKQGELPRTWSDILGGFGCGEIKRFPLEGQALTNARHAIPCLLYTSPSPRDTR